MAALPPALGLASPPDRDRAAAVLRTASSSRAVKEGFAHQAVEDALARERARVARELHDGIATELAGAISLFKVYFEKSKGRPDETLTNLYESVEESLQRVRESPADLRAAAGNPDGPPGHLARGADDLGRPFAVPG